MAEEKKNWKTSTTGVLKILLGVIFLGMAAFGLNIEGIEPDMAQALQMLSGGLGGFGVLAGIQGLVSKDADKKPKEEPKPDAPTLGG